MRISDVNIPGAAQGALVGAAAGSALSPHSTGQSNANRAPNPPTNYVTPIAQPQTGPLSPLTGALQWLFEPQPGSYGTMLQTPTSDAPGVNISPAPSLWQQPLVLVGIAGAGLLTLLLLTKKKRRH